MATDSDFFTRIPRFLRREERSDPKTVASLAPPAAPRRSTAEPDPSDRRQDPIVVSRAPGRIVTRGAATGVEPPPRAVRQVVPLAEARMVQRTAGTSGEADSPFQVTLPKELIRQIRVRAAEEDTTHRAIILRALKTYGFSIQEGDDVDRRKATPRRG